MKECVGTAYKRGSAQPSRTEIVYVVGTKIRPIAFKVGKSTSGATYAGRIKNLQAGNPEKLATYALFYSPPPCLERALHRYFDQYRMESEWFARNDELDAVVRSSRDSLFVGALYEWANAFRNSRWVGPALNDLLS